MAFQKLLKYLNSTIIFTSFVPAATNVPVIFCLYVNEALLLKSALVS